MKNKTKLILGLSAVLSVSAAAATAGTLAWFTTSRNASITFTGAGIYTTGGKLNAKYIKVANGGTVENSSADYDDIIEISGSTNSESDISGLAPHFKAVTWNPKKAAAADTALYQNYFTATAFTDVEATDNAYVHFQLNLKNEAAGSVSLVLQNGTDITPYRTEVDDTVGHIVTAADVAADAKAAKSTRVAILNSSSAIKSVFAHSSDTKFTYVSVDEDKSLYGLAGYTTTEITSNDYFHNVTTDSPFDVIAKSSDAGGYNSLGTLAAGGDATYDVYVWAEGTDSSCTNEAKTGRAQVKLVFSTVNS